MAPLCTSSQVNLLVYHYLKESGFLHACFSLRHEGRLDDDPLSKEAVIEPGQLVRVLQKGLLYMAVEAHVNPDGTEKACSAPFSLVGPPHVCDGKPRASDPPAPTPPARLTPSPPPAQTSEHVEIAIQTNAQTLPNGWPATAAGRPEAVASTSKAARNPAVPAEASTAAGTSSGGGKRKAGAKSGGSGAGKRARREASEPAAGAEATGADAGVNGRAGNTDDDEAEAEEADEEQHKPEENVVKPVKGKASRAKAGSTEPGAESSSSKRSKGGRSGGRRNKEPSASASGSKAKTPAPANIPPLGAKLKVKEVAPARLLRLRGHTAEVLTSVWNPTVPGLLASGAGDATVRIWDLSAAQFGASDGETGVPSPAVCKHLPATHAKDVSALDWNPDGTLLASGSFDGILRLWTPQGDLHLVMSMHQGPIFTVRWNRKGNLLLTGSADGTAIVWDLGSGKVRQQFSLHSDSVLDIDWLVGPRWSAAAIGAAPGAAPSSLADNTFATCSADNSVNLLRIGEAKPVRTLRGHSDEVNSVRFDPTGTLLASASDDMTCRIWSLDNVLGHGFAGAGGMSASSDLRPPSPDASGGGGGDADMDVDEEDGGAAGATAVGKGRGGGRGGGSPRSSLTKQVLRGHTKELYSVAWAPFSSPSSSSSSSSSAAARLLATSSFDRTARLWNAEDGSCLRTFAEHSNNVYSVCFSPDARFLATGGTDHRVFVQRIADGRIVKAYSGAGPVMDISWQCHPPPTVAQVQSASAGATAGALASAHAARRGAMPPQRVAVEGGSTSNGAPSSRANGGGGRIDDENSGGGDAASGGHAAAAAAAALGESDVQSYCLAVASSDRALTILDVRDLLGDAGESGVAFEGSNGDDGRSAEERRDDAGAAEDDEGTATATTAATAAAGQTAKAAETAIKEDGDAGGGGGGGGGGDAQRTAATAAAAAAATSEQGEGASEAGAGGGGGGGGTLKKEAAEGGGGERVEAAGEETR